MIPITIESTSAYYSKSKFYQKLKRLIPRFVRAAQKEYDRWKVDEDGYDDVVGVGGICHLIADKICDVLASNRIDCTTYSADDRVHVWAIAWDDDEQEAFNVDIPPEVYETGGGYTWKKIEDVRISPHDVVIEPIGYEDLKRYVEEQHSW